MKLSIIIAYHNEGQEFLSETLRQIKETCDVKHEIIIVDDHSDKPLELNVAKNVYILRHCENKGVGSAFDTGVRHAHCNNIFLMGCDVRFIKNNWASKMVADIESHENSLICTSVVPLSGKHPEITIDVAKQFLKIDLYRGASIKFVMGDDENPHHIIEAQWMPREFLPLRRPDYVAPTKSHEVACILGAAYGTTKSWYQYIDGFWGHKFWGTLEPYISMKSWMMGGRCLVNPVIETGHIFNEIGTHTDQYHYGVFKSYNRMLVSWLLFPDEYRKRLIDWLPDKDFVNEAKEMITAKLPEIIEKRNEYRSKFVMSMDEFVRKFNLEL